MVGKGYVSFGVTDLRKTEYGSRAYGDVLEIDCEVKSGGVESNTMQRREREAGERRNRRHSRRFSYHHKL